MRKRGQRGESRDYIPTRQEMPKEGGSLKEGLAFKATADKRGAHYRKESFHKASPLYIDWMM